MKKSPADEEAVKQFLQEFKKKIVENLRFKGVIEEFLNSCKENMPNDRVSILSAFAMGTLAIRQGRS